MLRAHAGEHLLLGVAKRSIPYTDFLLLGKVVKNTLDFIIHPFPSHSQASLNPALHSWAWAAHLGGDTELERRVKRSK